MSLHTEVGHPYLEEKNHASKGVHKSMALGGGGRFAALKSKIMSEGKSSDSAGAIAASIGIKKYGAKKFNSLSH